MVKVSTQQTQEQFYSKQGLSKTMGVGGGGGNLKPPHGKTALVLASQVPDVLVQCVQFIALQTAPFENVDHSCLYAAKRQKKSQLGDLPSGATFSNRSQERSWKSWEALGDTRCCIFCPFP